MKEFLNKLKGDKKKFVTSSVAMVLLVIMLIGATYAYFKSVDASNSDFDTQVTTNTVDSLVFKVDNDISITANPGNFNVGMGNQEGSTHATATLKANNKTNNATGYYYLYLDVKQNEFKYTVNSSKPELLLQISGPDGEVTEISGLEYKTVVDGQGNEITGFDITTRKGLINLIINREITTTSEKTDNWDIKVIFVNLTEDQNINGGKKFNAEIVISKDTKEELYMLKSVAEYYHKDDYGSVSDNSDGFWEYKENITAIVFEEAIFAHINIVDSFDISDKNSKPVMAYLANNGDGTYTAYIQAEGKLKANTDSSYLFYNFKKLQTIDGIENLDVSNVTDMSSMFYECKALTELNVGTWDTSNVTTMESMFYNCNELAELDVRGWDTGQIRTMDAMFYYCKKLANLDVSGWDTSNFTSMHAVFMGCYEVAELDVSNWDTSKVTDMGYLFIQCSKVTTLDVSKWNTSQVVDMQKMFNGCSSLETVDVSKWDTSQVKYMREMFNGCNSLQSLDLSKWVTSNVTTMEYMFQSCTTLEELDLSNFDTSKVTQMAVMFNNCANLKTLNLSSFDTSKVTSMYSMFGNCPNLTSLDIRNATFTQLPQSFYWSGMFSSNSSSIHIIVKDATAKTFIEARLNEANGGIATVVNEQTN